MERCVRRRISVWREREGHVSLSILSICLVYFSQGRSQARLSWPGLGDGCHDTVTKACPTGSAALGPTEARRVHGEAVWIPSAVTESQHLCSNTHRRLWKEDAVQSLVCWQMHHLWHTSAPTRTCVHDVVVRSCTGVLSKSLGDGILQMWCLKH